MKIYVEELPKSCDKCPCFYDENISCQASDKWLPLDEEDDFSRSTQRHSKCPLQSLAEHDKQVRKEVCDEIRNFLNRQEEIVKIIYYNSYQMSGLKVVEETKEVLDQIQGEK